MVELDIKLSNIANAAYDKKANDIVILNLKGISDICDYFIIFSADSIRRVRAIADNIEEALSECGIALWRREGYSEAEWVLLDYGNIIVHIFYSPVREYYDLENLWCQAQRIPFQPKISPFQT